MSLKKSFLFLLATTLVFTSFFYLQKPIKADSDKTVVITFASAPTAGSITVSKADLKYNKDFALSYTFDDGYIEGYNPVFRYLHGGYVDELGETVGGLYYSDGTGRRVPFKGAFNWFSNGSVSFGDLHIDTPSNMTWDDLRETYALGWEPINHGWTSRYTPDPPDTIINYPDPHGPSPINYDYEVSQNTLRLFEELSATIKHFGLPAGDDNYIPAAWSNGMKTISHGHPSAQNNYGLIDTSETLDFDQFEYMRTYFADETTLQDMKDYVDMIAESSVDGAKYWGVATSHRVRTPVSPPDSGNLDFNNFKGFIDYTSDTYGIDGIDSIWMASVPEVYEYLVSKQQTIVNTSLEGNTLTITLDDSGVDTDLRRYALSLIVEADADIASISYGTDFTYHSENKDTGLINLDWGFISTDNDLTRCEDLISTAESSKSRSDVDTARTYVNLLDDGSEKTAFMSRLDDIEVNLTA
ncbi:MAG: hypothetical protein K9M44_03800 [Candidatus Pacebacteria bacterium]|nr:hypothetical protein [Candidatus Paceibacterota bacterium]